jgi:hypothetical protein
VGYGYGGPTINIYSRNNILDAGTSINDRNNDPLGNYDYDLYRRGIPSGSEPNGIMGIPIYNQNNREGEYALSPSSPGYDDGVVLLNFNDDFTGSNPDMGAHEAGTPPMEFGVNAYRTQPPISPTPTPAPNPGDGNNDGLVDGRDFIIWLLHYGQDVSGVNNGDYNDSGEVEIGDYVVWVNNYTK